MQITQVICILPVPPLTVGSALLLSTHDDNDKDNDHLRPFQQHTCKVSCLSIARRLPTDSRCCTTNRHDDTQGVISYCHQVAYSLASPPKARQWQHLVKHAAVCVKQPAACKWAESILPRRESASVKSQPPLSGPRPSFNSLPSATPSSTAQL